MEQDLTELHPHFVFDSRASSPSISADGRKIVFHSRSDIVDELKGQGWTYDLYVRVADKISRITNLRMVIYASAISPDGDHVVFIGDKEKRGEISLWLGNTDGSGIRQIKIPAKFR